MTDIECNHPDCENNINGHCTKYFISISYIVNKPICVSYRIENSVLDDLKNAPKNFKEQGLKPHYPKEYAEHIEEILKEGEK